MFCIAHLTCSLSANVLFQSWLIVMQCQDSELLSVLSVFKRRRWWRHNHSSNGRNIGRRTAGFVWQANAQLHKNNNVYTALESNRSHKKQKRTSGVLWVACTSIRVSSAPEAEWRSPRMSGPRLAWESGRQGPFSVC